jgi:glycerophosphoryl diester phosphodiesterase
MFFSRFVLVLCALALPRAALAVARPVTKKLVIAHRGASGYLPEHTLPAATLAHGLGADFIEPDVVLSKDAVPVILHDIHLETTTDVAQVFPDRKRADGRWYAIDFTLDELRRLAVHERFDLKTMRPSFPQRFPGDTALLRIPTLEEMILLVQGLNRSTGRDVGLYPELKAPDFHQKEGQDIARVTLALLAKHGYASKESKIFVQCFDPRTLKRIRHELASPLRLVQLIAENSWNETPGIDYEPMKTEAGLKEIATYADGIGPWIPHVLATDAKNPKATPKPTQLVAWAHAHGLVVHPYTVRADQLPPYAQSIDDLHRLLFVTAGVDGVFTDFADKTRAYLTR